MLLNERLIQDMHETAAAKGMPAPAADDLPDNITGSAISANAARTVRVNLDHTMTPTLLMHGENDNDVPIAESEQFYMGLKDAGVETVMVRYPREGHGLREPTHTVDMITRCSALDFAPHGVRVNAVNPGVVVTELHTVTSAVADYPAFLERGKATHPLGRVGSVEEIAALVLFLLSDEAGWITGACMPIDGGRALSSAR